MTAAHEKRIAALEENVSWLMNELAATRRQVSLLSKKTPDAEALALTIRNDVNSLVTSTMQTVIEPKLKQINRQLYELGTDDTMVSEFRNRVMNQSNVEDHRRGQAAASSSSSHSFLAFRDGPN